jgi:hypothetical protein
VLSSLLLLTPSWLRLNATTLQTRHELRQRQPCHIQQPCCPPPPHPMTYVGAVLSTMGGSTRVRSLALALLAIVEGRLRTVRQRAQPRCRTGCRHHPWAPSPPDEILPFHPHPTVEGLSTPTNPPNLLARVTTRSWMPSLAPPLTASSTLPPPYPLPLVARYVYLWRELLPIHSVLVA